MQHHPKQLLSQVKEHRKDFVDLLEELVEIETPTGHRNQQNKLLDVIERHLHDLDFFTDRLSGSRLGGQLYARPRQRRQDAPFQLLVGYCDTNWPVKTLQKMPYEWDQQYIRGPGVYQMKGGLAMLLTALKMQEKFDLTPALTPVIYIYSDEKLGSPESRPTIERLSRYADRALILEPALEKTGDIITSSKGIGTFQVWVRNGTSKTGLEPDGGNGNVLELSHIVQRLYDLTDPQRDIQVSVSEFDGGVRSNVITGDHRAKVDITLAHPEDIKAIEKAVYDIESYTTDIDLSIEGKIQRPPMPHTQEIELLWKKMCRIAESLEIKVDNGLSEQASVGTLTSPNVPTLGGMGPVGFGAETPHETIDLEKTLERCALFSLMMAES